MARRNRWEHLNEFKKNEAGKYEYQGKSYVFSGTDEEKKSAYLFLWSMLALSFLFSIASGCISGAGITNTFYVILPYLLEISCLFVLVWNHCRMFAVRGEIRSYAYRAAQPKLPVAAMLLAFFAIAGLLMSLVFSVTTGFKDGVLKAVLYMLLKLLSAGAALLYRCRFLKLEWVEI